MEVIKPMDFSSFTAFCEHLNRSSTKTNVATSNATTITTNTTLSPLSSPTPPTPTTTPTPIEQQQLLDTKLKTVKDVLEIAKPDKCIDFTIKSPQLSNLLSLDIITKNSIEIIKNETSKINGEIHHVNNMHNGDNNNSCNNIDIEKMERQGKMEMAAKERESQRLQSIPKKWNRREEYEFLRVLTGYGVDLQQQTNMGPPLQPDWTKFKQMAHLERKSDETLSDYYKVFIAMCKRQAGVKLSENERGLDGIIEDINEDHARLVLDRLELLSKLREVARHPQLDERIKLCQMNADTPDWWEPGRHDKELITAVLKHGLYRSETFIFNDPNFSFSESEKRFIRELEAQIQRSIKLEAFNIKKAAANVSFKSEIIDLDADENETPESLVTATAVKIEPEQVTVKADVKIEAIPADEVAAEKPTETIDEKTIKSDEDMVNEDIKTAAVDDVEQNKEEENAKVTEVTEEVAAGEIVAEKAEQKIDLPLETEKPDESKEEPELAKENSSDESLEKTTTDKDSTVDEEKPLENVDKMETDEIVDKTVNEEANKTVDEKPENVESETNKNSEEIEKDVVNKAEVKIDETNDTPKDTETSVEETESIKPTEDTELTSVDKEVKDVEEQPKVSEETVIEAATKTTDVDEQVAKTSVEVDKPIEDITAVKKPAAKTGEEEIMDLASGATDPDDDEVMKEKEKAAQDECKKQAAELKARFPDLEVIQPANLKSKNDKPKLEMCMIRWFKDYALERRITHIVSCIENTKWPVDLHYSAFAACNGSVDMSISLHDGIPHLSTIDRRSATPDVITITTDQGLTKHLPTSQMQQVAANAAAGAVTANALGLTLTPSKSTSISSSLSAALDSNSLNAAVAAAAAASGNNSVLSALLPGITSSAALNTNTPIIAQVGGKKRKRHIAIDVETERAKLHALLNSSTGMTPKDWETELINLESSSVGRRGASVSNTTTLSSVGNLQPPPAHQHTPMSRQNVSQFNKPAVPPMKTPPPTIMGAPMDLSSSLPKFTADLLKASPSSSCSGAIDLSEVQDFSISKKSTTSSTSSANLHAALSSAFPSMGGKGGKLDDTLNKLMKKNNCNIEEPVVGKEKKRKKLDEIVLGLSAAKEQKTFPDPSLPSSKKPQIPPSVSVTPANMASSINQNQQAQKPFTITVTTVPGKNSKNNVTPSAQTSSNSANSGLNALQNLSAGGLNAKDSLSAFLAQTMSTDPATFIKQQQKMMQCLPPAQRKLYENMLTEMGQVMKMSSAKYDSKVNKWLTDSSLNEQLASMDYGQSTSSSNSRRSNRQGGNSNSQQQNTSSSQLSKNAAQQASVHAQQQQQQQQQHHHQMQQQQQQQQQHHQQQQQQQQSSSSSMSGPQGLTGEEPVPVINKQTGKRLSGSKAPVLKRLMQWLTENPNYEVDPKWLEQMQSPMTVPSPKPSSSGGGGGGANMQDYGQSSKQQTHSSGRPSSTSSNASTSSHSQLQQQQQQQQQQQNNSQTSNSNASSNSKKSSRQSAIDQANAAMQFGTLAGLNPSLLASLPGLGFDPKNPLAAFDPKNPLLSMPFAGMPGMNNIPGLSNLNNMNLFASLAGMGNLGNLAGMDANSLATLMAAAGPALTGLGGNTTSSVGSGKNSGQSGSSSSSKKSKNEAAAAAAAAQTAALNAALSGSLGNSGNSGSGNSGSSSNNKNSAATSSASQLAAGFPFLFPNPSLLYPPMGLGGLNPYSMGSNGLGAAYDQLAQQYNLLSGGASGATSSSNAGTTQSKSHQSQSKSSSSRASNNSQSSAAAAAAASAANLMNAMAAAGMQGSTGSATSGNSNSQSSSRSSSRQSAASRAAAQASAEMAQLSNLLMSGADPQLLESISRMTGIDLAQASRLMSSLGIAPSSNSASDKRAANNQAAAAAAAQAAQEKQAAKEQQKWMESLARGALPTDLLTLQAFSQGKLPGSNSNSGSGQSSSGGNGGGSSSSSSNKSASKAAAAAAAAAAHMQQLPGMSSDLSQAFLAEIAAQAMAAAGGQLPLSGPGSLASLTGNLAGLSAPTSSSNSSSSSSKRQREQEAFKQQMDYYTKTLGLGSGISLIPTSSAGSSNSGSSASYVDDHHKSKRARNDAQQQQQQQQQQQLSAKDELAAAALAAGLPLNFGSGGMTSIEKSLRSSNHGSGGNNNSNQEADKVTLTPLNSAGIAANLPSQTTITIAPPITSSASSNNERTERNNESRISLTITNAADAAKLPPPYEEADELIIQPILKKQSGAASSSHSGSMEDLENSAADENRRSSSRLKRPRSGADHSMHGEQPPEKRRELRSTRHTRQSSSNMDSTLNLSSGNSDAEEKHD